MLAFLFYIVIIVIMPGFSSVLFALHLTALLVIWGCVIIDRILFKNVMQQIEQSTKTKISSIDIQHTITNLYINYAYNSSSTLTAYVMFPYNWCRDGLWLDKRAKIMPHVSIHRVKWRHGNFWLHWISVGQQGVLCEVMWWGFVALFEYKCSAVADK